MIVTLSVDSVEEMMCVTIPLVLALMGVNSIGTGPGVMVSNQIITICHSHVLIPRFIRIIFKFANNFYVNVMDLKTKISRKV